MAESDFLADRAKALREEALETLDKALAASGSERALLLEKAVRVHDEARSFEARLRPTVERCGNAEAAEATPSRPSAASPSKPS
jgi:hypothetical protein